MSEPEILRQEFELGFTYTRSTGPIVGRFLSALRDRKLLGIRGTDGTVYVPPLEFDPHSAAALSEFVEVADCGAVVSWCWVSEPRASHPFAHPFAWALVKLDGADVPLLHAVDGAAEQALTGGLRVRVRWAAKTRGHITDISCFEPLQERADG